MSTQGRLTVAQAWHLAGPPSWVATLIPVALGEVYCVVQGYHITFIMAVLLGVACVCMQAAVNTFNDYFDFQKGNDQKADYLVQHDAVLVYENVPPKQALLLGISFLVGAMVLAFPYLYKAGIIPWVIGLSGALVVWLYSGGPYPISYTPLGEVISGMVMGCGISLGIVAVVTGRLEWPVALWSIPIVLGIALIMMTNNTCDMERDRQVNRHTLPLVLGRKWAYWGYRCGVVIWLVLMVVWSWSYVGMSSGFLLLLYIVLGKPILVPLFCTPLTPLHRIKLMKDIVQANFIYGGTYVALLALMICR